MTPAPGRPADAGPADAGPADPETADPDASGALETLGRSSGPASLILASLADGP